MLTTHPSIMLGSYLWDEDRLPRDEFDARFSHLRAAMDQRNWSGFLVYGNAREHAALAYFTNFIPRMRWAMAVLPRDGAPTLLASMSSRDMPAMQKMTWIADVRSGWDWRWFEESVAKLAPSSAVGVIGFDLMTPILYNQIETTLAGHHALEDADDLVRDVRRVHRSREVALIQVASDCACAAAEALEAAWSAGKDIETAALEGERAARRMAVQDVRTLVSRDGGSTLEPYAARFGERPDRLLAYVSVKYMGYWAEQFVGQRDGDSLHERARSRLDKLLSALEPGISARDLQSRTGGSVTDAPPMLGDSLGHRIGLSPNEGDELRGQASFRPEIVYTLRAAAVDDRGRAAIASAMALVKSDGTKHVLTRRR